KIRNVKKFNYPARNLDRQLANEPVLEEWISIAKDLQQLLTDSVIETAVKRLPPEVFPISGNELIRKLKSRRDGLPGYAADYYKFLAKKVEVVGTGGREYFEVKRLNNEETLVNLYKINREGEVASKPYYSRIFKTSETREVRLFGLNGNDIYKLEGKVDKGIKIRVIGGPEKDSILDQSLVKAGKHKTEIYDDHQNVIYPSRKTKLHLSYDSTIHEYHYDAFDLDKAGVKPSLFYNYEDRFYLSLGYEVRKHEWRKYPFAYQQGV